MQSQAKSARAHAEIVRDRMQMANVEAYICDYAFGSASFQVYPSNCLSLKDAIRQNFRICRHLRNGHFSCPKYSCKLACSSEYMLLSISSQVGARSIANLGLRCNCGSDCRTLSEVIKTLLSSVNLAEPSLFSPSRRKGGHWKSILGVSEHDTNIHGTSRSGAFASEDSSRKYHIVGQRF